MLNEEDLGTRIIRDKRKDLLQVLIQFHEIIDTNFFASPAPPALAFSLNNPLSVNAYKGGAGSGFAATAKGERPPCPTSN